MNTRALAAQSRTEVLLQLRRGENLIVTLAVPLGILVFFAKVDTTIPSNFDKPVDFLVPGVLSLAVMAAAMVSLGIATGFERRYGVLKRLGSTPLVARRAARGEDGDGAALRAGRGARDRGDRHRAGLVATRWPRPGARVAADRDGRVRGHRVAHGGHAARRGQSRGGQRALSRAAVPRGHGLPARQAAGRAAGDRQAAARGRACRTPCGRCCRRSRSRPASSSCCSRGRCSRRSPPPAGSAGRSEPPPAGSQIGRTSRPASRSSIAGWSSSWLVTPYTRPRTTPRASTNSVCGMPPHAVALGDRRGRPVEQRGIGDPEPVREVDAVGLQVSEADCDDVHAIALVTRELLEDGQLLLARMAPRREERDHDRLAPQIGERDGPACDVVERERRCRRPDPRLARVDRTRRNRARRARAAVRVVRDDQREQPDRYRDRRQYQRRDRTTGGTGAAVAGHRASGPGRRRRPRRRRA